MSPAPVSRRRFGAAAGGLAGALLAPRGGRAAAEPAPRPPLAYGADETVTVVGVPRGAAPEVVAAAVRRAALAATDFAWLGRGDTVMVKPVCNSGNAYPATTDPVALRAMIELLRERGAGRVLVGDMSGVQAVRFSKDRRSGSTRTLMQDAGLARAIAEAGGELRAFEEAGWDAFDPETPAGAADWVGPVLMPRILREVDHVVLMPRCGRHVLAGSTLGLKAAVGWWRHDSRLEYHRDAATFSAKTAEANWVPSLREKQRLVLTSATQVLTTFGPDDGYVLAPETGLVIAGPSVVAHDMVSLAWLLESRRATPEGARHGFLDDPNGSQTFVDVANRVVTYWLGGMGAAWRTQSLPRYDLATVWDDRVLRRAYAMAGGVPRVGLAVDGAPLPDAVHAGLAAAVRLPA
ncbi:MAG: DUF362 domain-containing protein [bacterium]|nr:DUF362 domain-containing protein [bacterium]